MPVDRTTEPSTLLAMQQQEPTHEAVDLVMSWLGDEGRDILITNQAESGKLARWVWTDCSNSIREGRENGPFDNFWQAAMHAMYACGDYTILSLSKSKEEQGKDPYAGYGDRRTLVLCEQVSPQVAIYRRGPLFYVEYNAGSFVQQTAGTTSKSRAQEIAKEFLERIPGPKTDKYRICVECRFHKQQDRTSYCLSPEVALKIMRHPVSGAPAVLLDSGHYKLIRSGCPPHPVCAQINPKGECPYFESNGRGLEPLDCESYRLA